MKDAATRQKEKTERKREKAKQDRQSASKVLASQREKMQDLRSKVFAAARKGDADAVRKGVWELDVDPSGGEIKPGCDHLVRQKPTDPRETLLHIAARHGDKDLVEWLGSHSLFPLSRCRPLPVAQTQPQVLTWKSEHPKTLPRFTSRSTMAIFRSSNTSSKRILRTMRKQMGFTPFLDPPHSSALRSNHASQRPSG